MSAKDYPDHLNPFDDNYTGAEAEPLASNSRKKYNTWSAPRTHKVSTLAKVKPSFLEKPWAALNISPNGKIVRRLSILKTAVGKFATKKTKSLSHSASYTEGDLPPRSRSIHDDFSFRIISPKLKEKIRQQAFLKPTNNQVPSEADPPDVPTSPQLNGRLSSLNPENEEPTKPDEPYPASPDSEKEIHLGARPKTRKKKAPPPPPIDTSKVTNLALQPNENEKAEDTSSVNSSITQDLEKDATSEDENSKAEFHDIRVKETVRNI